MLVPPVVPRSPPPPVPLPRLPHPATAHDVIVDVARLDPSGRLSTRRLMRVLGWRAGQRLDVDVIGFCIVVTASTTGRHVLTARNEVCLPAASRALASIDRDEPVLLTADPRLGRLIVRPTAAVARMLAELHIGPPAGGHDVG